MVWDSNPGRDKRFFPSQKCPDQLWGLPNPLFSGCLGSFSGVNQPGYEIQALHPVLMLRMSGAICLLPLHTFMLWTGGNLTVVCHLLKSSPT